MAGWGVSVLDDTGYGLAVITVDRRTVRAPESLSSQRSAEARAKAAEHFRASDARARQSTHRFDPVYGARDVRSALTVLFSNKCAFCESPLDGVSQGDVHHFRPKQGAVDPRTGETSRRHYWWLAYEWSNLYLVCARCNRAAGTRFAVDGVRARGGTTGAELRAERPLLLDPCDDDPTESLLFQLDGSVEPGSQRGEQTIETFALNRPALVSARLERIRQAEFLLLRQSEIRHELQADEAPYAGMMRQLIGALVPGGSPALAKPRWSSVRHDKEDSSAAVRIVDATIRNFRAIEALELEFHSEPDSWAMILGENGDGKTSVLQALGIALMTGSQRGRLDATSYVRHGARSGSITVGLSDRSTREVDFSADDPRFRSASAKQIVLAGYGAYRAPGRGGPRRSASPRVNSLLSPYVRLISPTEWLVNLDRRTFDAAAGALSRLLLDEEGFFQRRGGRVLYRRAEGAVALDDLSAGYRSTVALAVDLMSYMLTRWGDLEAAEGIVLIDELGTHLHPRWQMKVVTAFREAFPRIQFVATTHDPLCLRGLREGEVVVLRRDRQRRVFAVDDLPSVDSLYVDQLLTSEYFGLGSTLDPQLDDQFAEYYDLLSMRDPDERQRLRIQELRGTLAERGQLGNTERERLVLEAADQALAHRAVEPDSGMRAAMKDKAEDVIASLWLESES
jgi:uncharacterized protein (TIGR02646 family)